MISRTSRFVTAKAAALFGTTSFMVMAGASAAQAQLVAQAPIEEILITGSLIAGAPAVGIPVTAIGAEDFAEAGVLTTAELLRNVPALEVTVTLAPLDGGGGSTAYAQNVNIHGFSGSSGNPITLLLVNGRRWPLQGHNQAVVDPSLVPAIALDRVDILTVGASATYGSDAVSGVINVIMRRGYDGAMTRVRYSTSTDIGGTSLSFSQLWGTSWDTGNLTMSFETFEQQRVAATSRDYITTNFEDVGLGFDLTPLAASMPGVLTTGNPSKGAGMPAGFGFAGGRVVPFGTRYCGNCYAIPRQAGWDFGTQAPGPTTNWATLLNNKFTVGTAEGNTQNQRITYQDSWILPQMQRTALTFTVDQELADDFWGLGPVSFFADGFYSNRRSVNHIHTSPSGNGRELHNARQDRGMKVPTTNPYYPAGAPSGLQVHYTFQTEVGSVREAGNALDVRNQVGFNFDDLPLDWRGNVFYSMSMHQSKLEPTNMINPNNTLAALGNTIAADPSIHQAAYTKPAGIPFLNVFCDAALYQCNSPLTIDYISAYRNRFSKWKIREIGANFDGPIFDLPGGPLMAAVAVQSLSDHFVVRESINSRSHSNELIQEVVNYVDVQAYAYFGQLNIPLFGPGNAIPLIEALDIELGYRIDKYDHSEDFVTTPKISANWTVWNGLTLRGSRGEAFRNPSFKQTANARINAALGGEFETDCAAFDSNPSGTALAGSVTAILNPTCSTAGALTTPAGINVEGGSDLAGLLRGIPLRDFTDASGATVTGLQKGIGPESATQWILGFNWTPESGWFQGLNVDVSRFNIKIDGSITNDTSGVGVNDPISRGQFVLLPDPTQPITAPVNADFNAIIQALVATGRTTFDPSLIDGGTPGVAGDDVKFLHDNGITNLGFVTLDGIDFASRYDWDMGNWGAWNIGLTAYYEIDTTAKGVIGSPEISDYKGKNSGARLKRARARLGWSDGVWSITGFGNYIGHSAPEQDIGLPNCFWAAGFAVGDCYPGSPYWPQPSSLFGNVSPATVLFDLAIRYNTGLDSSNEYLRNLSFDLAISNVLNKRPPTIFRTGSRKQNTVAYRRVYDERQRLVSFTITKVW